MASIVAYSAWYVVTMNIYMCGMLLLKKFCFVAMKMGICTTLTRWLLKKVPSLLATSRRKFHALFLRRGGSIDCEVTGSRRYSEDLAQGGLEILCKLIFTGELKEVQKVQRLLKPVITAPSTDVVSENSVEVFKSPKTTVTVKDSSTVSVKVSSSPLTSVSIVESPATSVTVVQSSSTDIETNLQNSSELSGLVNYSSV